MAQTLLSVVFFRWRAVDYPALTVSGGPDRYGRDQVVINVRSGKELHLTLHSDDLAKPIFTLQSADKSPSVWDEHIRRIAAHEGWNPDQHTRYFVHQDLDIPWVGRCGREMASVRVYLDRVKLRNRYASAPGIRLDAPAENFMVTFGISRLTMKCACVDSSRHVSTSFGELCFGVSAQGSGLDYVR